MNKNIKGFTLIELLATISILGLIMIIVLPRVSKLIGENSNTKYKKYGETVIEASKVYTNSYAEDMFGNDEKSCAQIHLSSLINNGITEDIKVDDAKCSTPETFVKVTKNKDNYKYELSIKCVDKNDDTKTKYEDTPTLDIESCKPDIYEEIIIEEKQYPTVKAPPSSKCVSNNDVNDVQDGNNKVEVTIPNPSNINDDISLKYKWTNDKNLPGESDYDSYASRTPGKSKGKEKEFEVYLPANTAGRKYLHIYVADNGCNPEENHNCIKTGPLKDENDSPFVIEVNLDNQPPTIPKIMQYKTIREKKCKFWFLWCWKSETTIKKSDSLSLDTVLTPLDFPVYTKAIDSVDVGRCANTNTQVTYQYILSETDTDVKEGDNHTHNDEYDRTIYYKACDNEGNCSDYASHTIKFNADYLAPKCSTSASPSGWTNQSVTITGKCSDPNCADKDWLGNCKETVEASGCTSGETSEFIDYEVYAQFSPGAVYDNAGNSTWCDEEWVRIDKTDPNPPTYSDTVTEKDGSKTVKVNISGSDNLSGVDYYQCSQSGAENKSSFKVNNIFGIASTKITKTGSTTLSCYSVDMAGNKSSTTSHTVTISTTPTDAGTTTTTPAPSTAPGQESIPPTPTIRIYQWSDNSGPKPVSGSGLTEISSGQVSRKKVITVPSSPGAAYYKFTTTGATTNETDKKGSYRNIEAEGKSQISYRACNSSGQCSAENTASVTIVLCNSTKTTWGAAGTCNCVTGKQKVKGTKYSTIVSSIQCGTTEKEQDCTNYCKTALCDKDGSEVFGGTYRNQTSGNAGPWTLVSWDSNWCHSQGSWCKPRPKNGGWPRICVINMCKGMTAKEINTKYGCDFAPMWCQCNTSNI